MYTGRHPVLQLHLAFSSTKRCSVCLGRERRKGKNCGHGEFSSDWLVLSDETATGGSENSPSCWPGSETFQRRREEKEEKRGPTRQKARERRGEEVGDSSEEADGERRLRERAREEETRAIGKGRSSERVSHCLNCTYTRRKVTKEEHENIERGTVRKNIQHNHVLSRNETGRERKDEHDEEGEMKLENKETSSLRCKYRWYINISIYRTIYSRWLASTAFGLI